MADTRVVGFGPFHFSWERKWEERADAEAEEELRIAYEADHLREPPAPVDGAAEPDAKSPHPADESDSNELRADDDPLRISHEVVAQTRHKDKIAVAEPRQPLADELTQDELLTLRRLAESILGGENVAIPNEEAERIARKVGVGFISEAVEMYMATVPDLRSRSRSGNQSTSVDDDIVVLANGTGPGHPAVFARLTRRQSVDLVLNLLESRSLKPEEVLSLFDAIRSELDRFDVQERRLERLTEQELQEIRNFISTTRAASSTGDLVTIPPVEGILMLKLGVGSISEAVALYLAVMDRPGDDLIGRTKGSQPESMDEYESRTRQRGDATNGASTQSRGEGEDARDT